MDRYCPKCFNKYPDSVEKCPEHGIPLVSPVRKDIIGTTIQDRYVIKRRIGEGGFGVVYEAEQMIINRRVALKVLKPEIVSDESAVKRFLNEARAMATLRNPHTITLYDFGVTQDGLLFYTMDLLEGQPLSRILKREGPMDFRRVLGLLLQCCESLDEAHERGILHRDIKPENLFISRDRKNEEFLKVLDFGIAKVAGDQSMASVTRTGMICGTPAYMAPEVVMGDAASPASDMYALGVVLYEMLAGEPPFSATTAMKLLLAHLNDAPLPVARKNPKALIPVSVEEVVLKALAKKAEARYTSAGAFAAALKAACEESVDLNSTASLPKLVTTASGTRELQSASAAAAGSDVGGADQTLAQMSLTDTRGQAAQVNLTDTRAPVASTEALQVMPGSDEETESETDFRVPDESGAAYTPPVALPPSAETGEESAPEAATGEELPPQPSQSGIEAIPRAPRKWAVPTAIAATVVVVATLAAVFGPWSGKKGDASNKAREASVETLPVETPVGRPAVVPEPHAQASTSRTEERTPQVEIPPEGVQPPPPTVQVEAPLQEAGRTGTETPAEETQPPPPKVPIENSVAEADETGGQAGAEGQQQPAPTDAVQNRALEIEERKENNPSGHGTAAVATSDDSKTKTTSTKSSDGKTGGKVTEKKKVETSKKEPATDEPKPAPEGAADRFKPLTGEEKRIIPIE